MQKRQIHFAKNSITVEFDGEVPSHLVDFLFHYIPENGPDTPHLNYRLIPGEAVDDLVLYLEDEREASYQSEAGMAVYLMEQSCFHLADKSQGGLVLHAAALCRNGIGLLLPGTTRSGKSSLTAWMCNQGFDYMTDELSYLPLGEIEIHAFTRPLSLKKDVRPLFRELITSTRRSDSLLRTFTIDLFSPAGLPSGKLVSNATLRRIVFPHFIPDAGFDLQELSKAKAGLGLMRCLVNARNLPEHGLPEIVRISQTIPAYSMTYGSFDQIGQAIEGLL